MTSLEGLWPPIGLSISCGPLTLRAIRDNDLPEFVDAAAPGIHSDDLRPFPRAWAGQQPLALGRDLASRYWKYRATFPSEEWALPLVARDYGRIVGVQGAEAVRYPVLRPPDTFSWLTKSVQGQGVGTLMRQAICAFFFDELDAHAITSGAYADNPASAAVSRKVAGLQERLLVKAEGRPGVLRGPGGVPSENRRRAQSAAQITQLSALGAGLGLLQLTCHSRSRLERCVNTLLRRRKCRLKSTHLPPPPSVVRRLPAQLVQEAT